MNFNSVSIYQYINSVHALNLIKNMSLNMKNNTAYFSHISKDFWSPEGD